MINIYDNYSNILMFSLYITVRDKEFDIDNWLVNYNNLSDFKYTKDSFMNHICDSGMFDVDMFTGVKYDLKNCAVEAVRLIDRDKLTNVSDLLLKVDKFKYMTVECLALLISDYADMDIISDYDNIYLSNRDNLSKNIDNLINTKIKQKTTFKVNNLQKLKHSRVHIARSHLNYKLHTISNFIKNTLETNNMSKRTKKIGQIIEEPKYKDNEISNWFKHKIAVSNMWKKNIISIPNLKYLIKNLSNRNTMETIHILMYEGLIEQVGNKYHKKGNVVVDICIDNKKLYTESTLIDDLLYNYPDYDSTELSTIAKNYIANVKYDEYDVAIFDYLQSIKHVFKGKSVISSKELVASFETITGVRTVSTKLIKRLCKENAIEFIDKATIKLNKKLLISDIENDISNWFFELGESFEGEHYKKDILNLINNSSDIKRADIYDLNNYLDRSGLRHDNEKIYFNEEDTDYKEYIDDVKLWLSMNTSVNSSNFLDYYKSIDKFFEGELSKDNYIKIIKQLL